MIVYTIKSFLKIRKTNIKKVQYLLLQQFSVAIANDLYNSKFEVPSYMYVDSISFIEKI